MSNLVQLLLEGLTEATEFDHQQQQKRERQGQGTFQLYDAKAALEQDRVERLEEALDKDLEFMLANGRHFRSGGILGAERRADLCAALQTLPPRIKEFVRLRYLEGRHPVSVCTMMGISSGTYKDYKSKALRGIEQMLKVKVKENTWKKSQSRSTFYDADGKPHSMVIPRQPDMLAFCYAKIFSNPVATEHSISN